MQSPFPLIPRYDTLLSEMPDNSSLIRVQNILQDTLRIFDTHIGWGLFTVEKKIKPITFGNGTQLGISDLRKLPNGTCIFTPRQLVTRDPELNADDENLLGIYVALGSVPLRSIVAIKVGQTNDNPTYNSEVGTAAHELAHRLNLQHCDTSSWCVMNARQDPAALGNAMSPALNSAKNPFCQDHTEELRQRYSARPSK